MGFNLTLFPCRLQLLLTVHTLFLHLHDMWIFCIQYSENYLFDLLFYKINIHHNKECPKSHSTELLSALT